VAVHRLDRGPGHRQWAPGGDRPLAQLPLRGGDRRDGRRLGRPPHPVRPPHLTWLSSSAPPTASTTSRSPGAVHGARARAGGCRPARCSFRSPSEVAACWAGCYGSYPGRWPERHGGRACWTLLPAGCCLGSAPVAAPATAVASGTAPKDLQPSSPFDAALHGRYPGALRGSTRRLASASAPRRADPSLVYLTIMIEAVRRNPVSAGRARP
jgi:hypothetical protein